MASPEHNLDLDVAIVGYGPVGQALAALLGEPVIASGCSSAFRRSIAFLAPSISITR